MLKSSLLTLAAVEWEKIVTAAVFVVIVFGSAIANLIKKWLETKEQNKRQTQGGEHQSGSRLDDLAARRREQLQAAARQRQQPSAQTRQARPGGTDPANLSMAERIARARAQAQYNKRSQKLQQGTSPQAASSRAQDTAAQQMRQQQAAQQQARRAQEAAQQQARAQQQQARQQQARAQQQARQRAAPQPPQRQAAPVPQRRRSRTSTPTLRQTRRMRISTTKHKPIDAGKSVVHRHVPEASPGAIAPHLLLAGERLDAKMLAPHALRQAILLKEILDKPLALR